MVPSCNWQKYSHSQFNIIISLYWNSVFTYVDDSVRNLVVLSQRLPLTSLVSDMCKGLFGAIWGYVQVLNICQIQMVLYQQSWRHCGIYIIFSTSTDVYPNTDTGWLWNVMMSGKGRRWENCSHSLVSHNFSICSAWILLGGQTSA